LLLVGAILGAIVAPAYNGLVRWARALAVRQRARESRAGLLATKIVAYYRERGLTSSLYVPQMVGPAEPIALLHQPDIEFPKFVGVHSDSLFTCDHLFTPFQVSNHILRWYRRRGVRLFDGEFMWVKHAEIENNDIRNIHVGRFNFFAYATLCFQLQREVLSRWRRPRRHDRFLRTFDSALASDLKPRAVGCVVATLLQDDDELYVLIARRSNKVLNGPGTRACFLSSGWSAA
jgi:hypothetical protein